MQFRIGIQLDLRRFARVLHGAAEKAFAVLSRFRLGKKSTVPPALLNHYVRTTSSARCAALSEASTMAGQDRMQATNIVFLFDVDNTLLDHDYVTADLKRHLQSHVGQEHAQRYWQVFEKIRSELGYADYLGALQRYRIDYPHDPNVLAVSYFLLHYPFANRLFPNSIDALEHVAQWGSVVIISDGDVVFQPHKVYRSGLFELFRGNVLIYVHKEQELEDVEQRFPAGHYVVVDDKLRILHAIKQKNRQ